MLGKKALLHPNLHALTQKIQLVQKLGKQVPAWERLHRRYRLNGRFHTSFFSKVFFKTPNLYQPAA
jgi:hypothetical protein